MWQFGRSGGTTKLHTQYWPALTCWVPSCALIVSGPPICVGIAELEPLRAQNTVAAMTASTIRNAGLPMLRFFVDCLAELGRLDCDRTVVFAGPSSRPQCLQTTAAS